MLGPAAIIGLVYYLQKRQYDRAQEQIKSFEQGRFDLREMTVTEKNSQTRRNSDGDTSTTYYLSLRQEDGRYSTRVSVSQWEYERASKGEIYYVLLINGVSAAQFGQKDYKPDAEMQAILDGQKPAGDPTKAGEPEPAADGPEAGPIPIDIRQIQMEEEQSRAKARRALWLNRGRLAYLAVYGIAALGLLAKGAQLQPRFAALPDTKKIPLILLAFGLLWGMYYAFSSILRKCMKGVRLKQEQDGALIRGLLRGGRIAAILFWLEHVLMFFLLWGWMK